MFVFSEYRMWNHSTIWVLKSPDHNDVYCTFLMDHDVLQKYKVCRWAALRNNIKNQKAEIISLHFETIFTLLLLLIDQFSFFRFTFLSSNSFLFFNFFALKNKYTECHVWRKTNFSKSYSDFEEKDTYRMIARKKQTGVRVRKRKSNFKRIKQFVLRIPE